MKICSIRLENARRFTEAVEISGIGPGLNVLSAPNEQGKSTIFDALHAVFFKDAKSWDKEVRALVPRAGGEPRIEVELEREGLRYRLIKQFQKASGKGEVRLWRGETLYLQSDAAEAWVQELIKSPKEGGPAGLLWVRQGLTDFADAKETLSARQNLLSSITGEISAVTGGQRMDAIRRDLRQSLDRLVTSRGAKKGGALDLAQIEVAQLQEQEDVLQARVQELRSQLDQRCVLRAELAELQDAETQKELEMRLQAAQTDLAAAEQYQEKLKTSSEALKTAGQLKDTHLEHLAGLKSRQQEYLAANSACAETATQLEDISAKLAPAEQALRSSTETASTQQDKVKKAEALLARVLRHEVEVEAKGRRQALCDALEQARKVQQQVAELTARSKQGPDRKTMGQIEAAREALSLAEQAQQLTAPAVMAAYASGSDERFLLDGAPLMEGTRVSLPAGGQIVLPGIGAITVHPGQGGELDQLTDAQGKLSKLLEAADCKDLAQARESHRRREEAAIRLKDVEAQLVILAPQGVLALMQQVDALMAEAAHESPDAQVLPERGKVEADLIQCRAMLDQAASRVEAAQITLQALRQGFEAANARHQAAQQRLTRAEAGLPRQEDITQTVQQMEQRAVELQLAFEVAQQKFQALQQQAPDLATVQARASRAKSAQSTARDRLQELGRDLAILDTKISATAGEAVEEQLAEVRDRLVVAERRLQAVAFEVAVMRRLEQALERARSAAQDAYVAPVLQELQPLLRLLWPQARLDLDADRVLPQNLQRGESEEDFDSLSGGTQEQIALLVRLAFARLLARSGAAAPVILDDAIVYTDDARIERLFDALTVQASDLQILVFTCRQKSFRSLGGTQLAIRPVNA